MAITLCPDRPRATIAILAAIVILAWPAGMIGLGQVLVIAAAGVIGWRWLKSSGGDDSARQNISPLRVSIARPLSVGSVGGQS